MEKQTGLHCAECSTLASSVLPAQKIWRNIDKVTKRQINLIVTSVIIKYHSFVVAFSHNVTSRSGFTTGHIM
jgi:hypothetical protein